MIEINLLPESLRRKESPRFAFPVIPIKKSLIVVGAAVAILQIALTSFAFYVRFELISLNRKTDVMKKESREIIRQKGETIGLYNRMKEIRSLTARKFYWASLLSELSNSMTKGIWLRNLYVEQAPARVGAVVKSSEDQKKAKDEEGQAAKKKPSPKKGEIPKKSAEIEKKKKPPKTAEPDKYLVLEGTAIGVGQETAYVGKFLKELKDNPFFARNFQEMKPSNINQKRIGDYEVYDFMIRCQFRRDKTR
jgi:hypothetical protein